MTEPIRYCTQVSRTLAQVFTQHYRDLAYAETSIRKTSNHFCCKFHTWAFQSHFQRGSARYTSQTAVEICNVHLKPTSAQPGQQWYAKIAMAEGHCARNDAPGKPIADHQMPTLPEFIKDRVQIRKIIAAITITDDDILTPRSTNAAPDSIAVSIF